MEKHEKPRDRTVRRVLTAALMMVLALLVMRLVGRHCGPYELPLPPYNLLVPLGLAVLLWRLLAAGSTQLSRSAASRWLQLIIVAITFLLFQPHIDSDGDYYYAYLRSLLWDRDLNLSNEAAFYATGWMKGLQRSLNWTTGYIFSAHTIGPSLFWLPFVLVAHVVALVLRAGGYPVLADGYDQVYRVAVSLGTWTFVLFGLFVCVRLLETWFQRAAALPASAGMLLASPMLCYGFQSGSFSHGLSFFTTAIALFGWVRLREERARSAAFRIGFLFGLACLIRPQNVLWLILPVADSLYRGGWERDWRRRLQWLLWMAGAAALAFSPQMLLWYVERRSILSVPQGPGFIEASRWNQWRVLFHPYHGLFVWHPLHLVALIGLIHFSRKNRRLGLLFLLGFALQTWINGAAEDWWAGGAFGLRRFGSSLPIFMIGLGSLLELACRDRPLWALGVAGICVAVLWNLLLLAQVLEGPLYFNSPIDFGTIWSDQFSVAPARLELLATRSPFIRWLTIGLADGSRDMLMVWLSLVLSLAALSALVTWTAPRVMVLILRKRRSATWWRRAVVAVPCVWVACIVLADITAWRVPVAFEIKDRTILTRRLALHAPARHQGGYIRFVLGPNEARTLKIDPPLEGAALLIVGGQVSGSVQKEVPVLRVSFSKTDINIPGRRFPPICPSRVSASDRPVSAHVVREWYRGTSGRAPFYSYGSVMPLGAVRRLGSLSLANLTADVTLAIEGITALQEIGSLPRQSNLAVVGPGRQVMIALDELANTDYLHHVFRERDLSQWQFFPRLRGGIYESGGIRFRILPSFDLTGRWSAVGILHKGQRVTIPVPAETYDGVSLAWVAYGTYSLERGRLPRELLAYVRFMYADGRNELRRIFSHRDIYDFRDPYVDSSRLVYQEALYQKICRTDFQLGRRNVPLRSILIETCWRTDQVGLALLAATAWRH